jgi:hypothetical protein
MQTSRAAVRLQCSSWAHHLQGLPATAAQVIASSPLLRKAAGSAALEVERGLYRRITSPAVSL